MISFLREWAFLGCLMMLPLVAYMIMHHPDYADKATEVQIVLDTIDNEQVQSQMITPVAMTTFLPNGLIGAFVMVMFAAFLTTNNSYLHSWGSILIQDVIIPLRCKHLTPKKHMLYLRLGISGVAVFIFIFSLVFRQSQNILLFMMITGAIWTGGAGSVIIGGLYWKRGTTAAAYSALIVGSVVAALGLILDQIWKNIHDVNFPIDYKWMSLISMVSAIMVYVIVSLLSKKPHFNLDKMLHRGDYAIDEEDRITQVTPDDSKPATLKSKLKNLLGITEHFALRDKVTYGIAIGYHLTTFGIFLFMTLFALFVNLSEKSWAVFLKYVLAAQLLTSFVVAIWLTCGGFRDLKKMFAKLRTARRNELDDGTVVDHHNLDEE